MRIDAGMDTGEMLLQRRDRDRPKKRQHQNSLHACPSWRTAHGGNFARVGRWTITAKAQNHAEASYAPMLKKEDGRIELERPAMEIYNGCADSRVGPGLTQRFAGRRATSGASRCLKKEALACRAERRPGTLCRRKE